MLAVPEPLPTGTVAAIADPSCEGSAMALVEKRYIGDLGEALCDRFVWHCVNGTWSQTSTEPAHPDFGCALFELLAQAKIDGYLE